MDFDFSVIIFTISLLVGYFVFKKSKNEGYSFDTLKVPYEKPWPIVGNMLPLFTGAEGGISFFERLYRQFRTEKVAGFYGLNGAMAFIVSDPELIKKITIKDFDHFVNRDRNVHNEISDKYFGKTVLQLRDQKWKDMRTMLTPIYTTSKLKMMFHLMVDSADEFADSLLKKSKLNNNVIEVDTRDIFARVTADGIATTALGFKGDCVANKDSEIFKIAHDLSTDFGNPVKMMIMYMIPKVYEFLGLQLFRKSIHEFFDNTIMGEFKRRIEGNISRPDVIQLLIDAKQGQLKHEHDDENDAKLSGDGSKISKNEWSDEDLIAQALVFFLGGFETTTSLLQALCYELSKNPEVQETLIEEVDNMLENLNGKSVSYDELQHMKYLDMVVHETLRMWPSFRALARNCSRDYILKDDETGQEWEIRKGIDIIIPFGAMCRDEKYFADPDKFDPTRFSEENKKNIPSGVSIIPFGIGPRMCIGSRYAMIEMKLVLFYVMAKFKIVKSSKTPTTLTFSKASLGYVEDIIVDFVMRKP